MDDFALSDVFFVKNLPVTNYVGKGIINIRMYEEGYQQLSEGWTKNLATASQSTHPFVMTLIQLWIFGVIMAVATPILALIVGSPLATFVSILFYLVYGEGGLYRVEALPPKQGKIYVKDGLTYAEVLKLFESFYHDQEISGYRDWQTEKNK